ncbi:hypothetical protein MRB53_024367 [Persea americana]|uniref:Uncharacterized protein n=1 Tax=Persea americana TaxID=3435 RepID=A0ACC2LC63_PERAE|nr:hypothetical protein MRB53_024367 [Persea americana]
MPSGLGYFPRKLLLDSAGILVVVQRKITGDTQLNCCWNRRHTAASPVFSSPEQSLDRLFQAATTSSGLCSSRRSPLLRFRRGTGGASCLSSSTLYNREQASDLRPTLINSQTENPSAFPSPREPWPTEDQSDPLSSP